MIRLGVIGAGVVANYGHIPAIKDTHGLTLTSLLDVDMGRLLEAKSRFNVPNTFTDADLFFQSGIDAVVICSPAPVHHDNVILAAKYGKPVLCEKPLAMSEAEAMQMILAMEAVNLPLYVGFTYRFAPPALDIHRLVKSGAIGKVKSLRLIYIWDCHGKYQERGNPNSGIYDRRHLRMLEGGPLVDCGVHQIDLARWWTGQDIQTISGHGAWVEIENYEAPDHIYLHADHVDGAHTMVEISFTYGHTSREPRCEFFYEVIGTEGIIRYDRQGRVFECANMNGTQPLQWHEEKNFHGMYWEFERALREKTPGNMPTGRDGLIATRTARLATEDAIARRKRQA